MSHRVLRNIRKNTGGGQFGVIVDATEGVQGVEQESISGMWSEPCDIGPDTSAGLGAL